MGVFVFCWWDHADGGVGAVLVVPVVDPCGDFLAGLGFGGPGALIDEFVLEGGGERLGGGVVQGVAGAPGGSGDAEPPAGFGGVLRAFVGMEDHAVDVAAPGGDCGVDRGFGSSAVGVMVRGANPAMRREHRSSTVAANTGPCAVLTSLKPPNCFWFIALAPKPRRSKSSAATWAGFWPVRPLFLGLGRAHRPWRAIDASTVLFDTAMPSRRSWAVTLGDP